MSGKGETFKDSKGNVAGVHVRQKDAHTIETIVTNDQGAAKQSLDIEEARKMHESLGEILSKNRRG